MRYLRALFPVDVLFEGVEIEQGEDFAARVVGPEWRDDFFFYGAGVSENVNIIVVNYK